MKSAYDPGDSWPPSSVILSFSTWESLAGGSPQGTWVVRFVAVLPLQERLALGPQAAVSPWGQLPKDVGHATLLAVPCLSGPHSTPREMAAGQRSRQKSWRE